MTATTAKSILGSLTGLSVATAESRKANEQTPMTPEYVALLGEKLKNENRMSVYPNRFNTKIPYQVQIRHGRTEDNKPAYHQQGTFENIEVATAVGAIAGKAFYGAKAIAGVFDEAVVMEHPEFIAWCNNPLNAETIRLSQVA